MSKKELLEKASDPVGGGATGASKAADPVDKKATIAGSEKAGEPMQKVADVTPGQSVGETDGENNTKAVGDTAASNKNSVNMKEEMLSIMGDDLSEEFKEKAVVVFEAAVAAQVNDYKASLEEEYNTKATQLEETYQTTVAEMKQELSDKVSEYLDYIVEEWMTQNEVAIETSLRTELTEDFIGKLKDLFVESYIEVPEGKVNVLDEMAATIESLEEKYNALVAEKIEIEKKLEESTKETVFADVSEGLTMTQVEKFRSLAEGVTYDNLETYAKKLEIVKEQYFTAKTAPVVKSMEEEEAVELNEEAPVRTASPVSRYVTAISRTAKK